MFGVWKKYGYKPNTWCLGLETHKVDKIASKNEKIKVMYWKNKKEYEVEAKKVQKYPKEQIKGYDLFVYVIPTTILKEINPLTDEQILRIALS